MGHALSDALTALLAELRREAGWENTSGATSAALAIARLEGDAPIRALVAELERADHVDLEGDAGDMADELWRLRKAVQAGLEAMGEPAVKLCAPLLHAARATPRDQVLARVCARGQAPGLFEIVAAWLADPESQFTAIECLGLLGDARGAELIRRMLHDGEALNAGWRKRLAAKALARLGDVNALHVLLDDADSFARLGVLEAAALVKNAGDRAQLIARGKADVDEHVRKVANAVAAAS